MSGGNGCGRWRTITSFELARAIVAVVGGAMVLLKEDYEETTSVWGQIATKLGSDYSWKVDRYWSFMAYQKDDNALRAMIQHICNIKKINYEDARIPVMTLEEVQDSNGALESNCVCQKTWAEKGSKTYCVDECSVKCDSCKVWFHLLCVGMEDSMLQEFKEHNMAFTCGICENVDDTVPLIFQDRWEDRPLRENSTFCADGTTVSWREKTVFTDVPTEGTSFGAAGMTASTPLNSPSRSNRAEQPIPPRSTIPPSTPSVSPLRPGSANTPLFTTERQRRWLKSPTKCNSRDQDGRSTANTTTKGGERQAEEAIVMDGPISISETFKMYIARSDWKEIAPEYHPEIKTKACQWKMSKYDFVDVFADTYIQYIPNPVMAGCTFKSKKQVVKPLSKEDFCRCTLVCTRDDCSIQAVFSIPKNPDKSRKRRDQDVEVDVEVTGQLHHDRGKKKKRKLQGKKRKEAVKQLLVQNPCAYSRKIWNKRDKNMVKLGNRTEVQNLNVFRTAKSQALTLFDLNPDPLIDVMMRKDAMNSDKKRFRHLIKDADTNESLSVKGFIQNVTEGKVMTVVLYTEQQLRILELLIRNLEHTAFSFDATGSVVTPLKSGSPNFLQYDFSATIIHDDASVIPLLSFLSNGQDVDSINAALHNFLARFREYSGIKKPNFGIRQLNTDCSLAIISASLMSMELGPTHTYLQQCWQKLDCNAPVQFVLHVCGFHANRFMDKKLCTEYKKGSEQYKTMLQWKQCFLRVNDLYGFSRRVKEAVLLCGKQEKDDSLDDIISEMSSGTVRCDGTYPWRIVDVASISDDAVFYQKSPWGLFATKICDELEVAYRETNERENRVIRNPNPFYNSAFLKYLIKNIFPIAPLLDRSLLRAAGLPYTYTTTGVGESCFSLEKFWHKDDTEMQEATKDLPAVKLKMPMKLGRYIYAFESVLRGRLNRFEAAVDDKIVEMEALKRAFRRTKQVATKSTSGVQRPLPQRSTLPTPTSRQTARKSTAGASKRRLSNSSDIAPESQRETWNKKSSTSQSRQKSFTIINLPRLPWGGKVTYDGMTVNLTNTCSIDNVIQILYYAYKTCPKVRQYMDLRVQEVQCGSTILFQELFEALDLNDFPTVRRIFLQDVLRKPVIRIRFEAGDQHVPSRSNGDLFGSEIFALETLGPYFEIDKHVKCNNPTCPLPQLSSVNLLTGIAFKTMQGFFMRMSKAGCIEDCDACREDSTKLTYRWGAAGAPPFVAVDLPTGNTNEKLLKYGKVNILDAAYNLFAYTLFSNERSHFYSIIKSAKGWYQYDGKYTKTMEQYTAKNKDAVSTVWFVAL